MRAELVAGLPAAAVAQEVTRRVRASSCTLVTAPPGTGKSTVLPLALLEHLPGRILLLEPRRLAARQVAERMAWLLEEPLGQTVGYRVRFESQVSSATRLEVMTEGILTRRIAQDPALEGVSAVIFDEFHERSLQSDTALALTRETQALLRPDLHLLLMSATLDGDSLAQTLGASLIRAEGKMYPVGIRYADADVDPAVLPEAMSAAIRQAHRDLEGDILAFLPGEAEIRRCAERLGTSLGDTPVMPLYGMLSSAQQQAAIAPSGPGQRKIVLSTPIAETSLTIEGVRVVVDGGYCKKLRYDPRSGLSRLETVRISADMAEQRKGRAGRVAPGVCIRLWTPAMQGKLTPARTPEILEADLSGVILDAACWGEPQVERLPWLTPPPASALAQGRALLSDLGAMQEGRILPRGRALAALPCHPRIAAMLLQAATPAQKALAADLAAILEDRDPLSGETQCGIDLRLRALRAARTGGGRNLSRLLRAATQFARMIGAPQDASEADPYEAGALLAAAYPQRIAQGLGGGHFQLATGERACLDPSDLLATAAYLVAVNLFVRPDGEGRIFLAAPIALSDLQVFAKKRDVVSWDSRQGCVSARQEWRIGTLLLENNPISSPDRGLVEQALCEAVRREGRSLLDWNEAVGNLQRRIAAAGRWHPELGLADVSQEALLSSAAEWLPVFAPGVTHAQQLGKIDMQAVIWSRLDYAQRQAVERLAPSHISVPSGSSIRIEYRTGADAPVVRVRLQECFGMLDTPRVDDGRLPLLMELLSPGYKPVQLTSDLRSFWTGTYFEVRKELRRRYPKHAWPEDPLTATAVRGVRKA